MKNLFHKGLCLVMALCCIAFKGYAGGGTLPDAQGHDLKLSYSRTTLKTVADAITQQVGIVFSYEIALADYPMENPTLRNRGPRSTPSSKRYSRPAASITAWWTRSWC